MPKYKVQDPTSGRSLTLEGDSPPTEQELNSIFASKVGLDNLGPQDRWAEFQKTKVEAEQATATANRWGSLAALVGGATPRGLINAPGQMVHAMGQQVGVDTSISPVPNLPTASPIPSLNDPVIMKQFDVAAVQKNLPNASSEDKKKLYTEVAKANLEVYGNPYGRYLGLYDAGEGKQMVDAKRWGGDPRSNPRALENALSEWSGDYDKWTKEDTVGKVVENVARPVVETAQQFTSLESVPYYALGSPALRGATIPIQALGNPSVAKLGLAAMGVSAAGEAPEKIAQNVQEVGKDPSVAGVTGAVVRSIIDAAIPYLMGKGAQHLDARPEPFKWNSIETPELRQGDPGFPFVGKHTLGVTEGNRRAIPLEDRTKFSETPIIGQRPILMENQVVTPQPKPVDIQPAYQASGEPKQGGQVSFEGQGVPSAMQAKEKVPTGQGKSPTPQEVGKELGLTVKQWPQEAPVLGGKVSYTDPKTGLSIENIDPTAMVEEVNKRMQNKLSEGPRGKKLYSGLPFLDPDLWRKREEELRGPFSLSGPRFAMTPSLIGFSDVTKPVDAQQLVNRLKNRLSPSEAAMYQDQGVFDKLVKTGKVSPEEAAKVMQEEGPRVEVHSYGMEGKVSEAKKEYDKMTHEWYDTLSEGARKTVSTARNQHKSITEVASYDDVAYSNPEFVAKANKYLELNRQLKTELKDTSPRATFAYSHVSALPTNEPMPEWTATKSGKNVQRVDVVIPQKEENVGDVSKLKKDKRNQYVEIDDGHGGPDWLQKVAVSTGDYYLYVVNKNVGAKIVKYLKTQGYKWANGETGPGLYSPTTDRSLAELSGGNLYLNPSLASKIREMPDPTIGTKEPARWQPDNLHENLPNTLGWAMIQYKTGPKGEKIAVIAEAQSRWGQELRELKNERKMDNATRWSGSINNPQDHPLLRDYNRLILKAAIEQARKEGATHIMVSDAETAMMTEGHDTSANVAHIYNDERGIVVAPPDMPEKAFRNKQEAEAHVASLGDKYIHQAPGMRLNYDTVLPKIAEELTGSKGEKVSLGEHKNAYKERTPTVEEAQSTTGYPRWRSNEPRENLIFRNADGTPKTDASGLMFDLSKIESDKSTKGSFTLFDKDKVETRPTYFYSGVPLPELKHAWEDFKTLFKGTPLSAAGAHDKWSPFTPPDQMKKELLESPTAKPISSKAAGVTLPSEGPKTTARDVFSSASDAFKKSVYTAYDLANKLDKIYSPMDVIFDRLDGGKATFDGPLFRNIRYPLDFDFNLELNLRDQHVSPVRDLVSKAGLKEKNGIRLGIYATVKQGMTDRLIENGVPKAYIDSVMKSMTPQELAVYKEARKHLDSLLPGVQSVAKDVYDMDVTPVDNYFPLQRDWRKVKPEPAELAKSRGGDVQDEAVEFLNQDFTRRGTKTEQGYTIARVPDAKTATKLNFFDVYERHIRDVAHFITSQKRLSEISKVVRDEKFQEKYGDYGQKLVMDWLNTYAKQGRSVNSLPLINNFRKAFARGVLGFRVASQFVHLANVPLGMQRAGAGWYGRGLTASTTEVGQAFLRKNLAETFERGGGEMEVLAARGPVETAAFAPQRFLDRWNSQATALGIYMRRLAESGRDPSEFASLPVDQKALAEARVLTRRAVASPLYKDLPPILTKQAGKVIMQFQNTFMDQWSNIRYDMPELVRNNPKAAMGLMTALAAMVMVESGIKYGAKKGSQAITGYTPKNAEDDTYWKKVQNEALRRIPGAGQLIASWEYGTSPVPIAELSGDIIKSAKTFAQAEDLKQKKLAGVQLATAGLEALGIPGTGQASELVQNKMKANYFKSHEKRIEDVAKEKGKDLSNFYQRLEVERAYKESRPPMSESERIKSAEGALKNMEAHRQTMLNGMSKEDQTWLKNNNIRIPGFGDSLTDEKTRVTFTEEETKSAIEVYQREHEAIIAQLRNSPKFKQLDENAKQVEANKEFSLAAKRAKKEVTTGIKNGTLVPKKESKRYSAFSPE